MFVVLEKMTFIFKKQEKQIMEQVSQEKRNMEQVKVALKCLGFGSFPSQTQKSTQTVRNKFLMKGYELNGQSLKLEKCDGRKRFKLSRRRCEEPLFSTSGSNSGG